MIKRLDELNINRLTDIQEKSIPSILKNNSLVISSQTGSGKTYCYLLPILNNIDCSKNKIQALIILPTKELARQVSSKI
ncbi:MAG: DEAD/DEAH box helicase, partial [Mycoplasmoidaceae bacterium]|nr:DEAD/DEAH box helicase [Mycoplasmoidaceae bacterium]